MSSLSRQAPLFFVSLIMYCLLHATAASCSDFKFGVLWAVSKPGIPTSYVLGTIHSDDPRVTRLPPAVARALANSRSFTGELDLNPDSLAQTQQALLLPDDMTLESLVGQTRYRQCVELMKEYGVPDTVVNRMKPWAVALQLNMPKPTTEGFLDLRLYQQAVARGLPVYALETIPEQTAVFDKLPAAQQIQLLDEAIASFPENMALIDSLIDLYLARDLEGMQAINAEQMQKGDSHLAEQVDQRLIIMRNHRMAKRMQARLDEGRAFIAIGALHLPGREGILNLLQQQGYLVNYVY